MRGAFVPGSRSVCLEHPGLRLIGFGEAGIGGLGQGPDRRPAGGVGIDSARGAEAEAMAQVTVESAVAGIGGPTVRGANSRAAIEVGRKREIEQRDVTRVIEHASRVQLHEDRMMLQACLQDFVVDDHPGHRDPRGMIASRIEANMHLITASGQEHDRLVIAMNQAHLAAEETVYEGLAACYGAVLPEERREGIALLDIGAHSRELAVYYGESLQLASSHADLRRSLHPGYRARTVHHL